jgi:hypothetical protein
MIGAIQFPKNIQQIPLVRIYYRGLIISPERDDQSKKIVFKIPRTAHQSHFYLLITKNLGCEVRHKSELAAHNTIEFWKITKDTPYKFFVLYSTQDEDTHEGKQYWEIKELALDESGRIPDDAIIIRYPAEYIEKLVDATSFELPTIMLKPNLLELIGSQTKLTELSDMLMLASLDTDTFHATVSQEIIQQDKKRNILVPPAT